MSATGLTLILFSGTAWENLAWMDPVPSLSASSATATIPPSASAAPSLAAWLPFMPGSLLRIYTGTWM